VGGAWVEALDGPGPDDAALRRTAIRTVAAQVCTRDVRDIQPPPFGETSCVEKSEWTY
jgi:hypothetical protein